MLQRVVDGSRLQGARHRHLPIAIAQRRQGWCVVVEHRSSVSVLLLLLVLFMDVADGVGLVVDVLVRLLLYQMVLAELQECRWSTAVCLWAKGPTWWRRHL